LQLRGGRGVEFAQTAKDFSALLLVHRENRVLGIQEDWQDCGCCSQSTDILSFFIRYSRESWKIPSILSIRYFSPRRAPRWRRTEMARRRRGARLSSSSSPAAGRGRRTPRAAARPAGSR